MTRSSQPPAAARGYYANLEALRAVRKPARGTPAYSRLVNRPLGRIVAAAVDLCGLSPNGATALSAIMSAAAIAVLCLCEPGPVVGLVVSLLLAGGYVMDSVDGQLARLRGASSVRGEWLDHTVDCFKTSSLHLAVAVSLYRFPPVDEPGWLLVPLAYCVVQAVTYFGLIIMPFLRDKGGAIPRRASTGPAALEHPLRTWLILPTDYGFLCWIFVLLAQPKLFLWVYAALALLSSVMLALALRKWWFELGALDEQRAE